ncbi:conserved Plasmodium protein, unknown function [Plasmodium ovale]|uniref:Uncharacterized protein n=1 Tax=Plasmodium ovale TaxID=36330 RepID=A0A1D3TLQ5_PLAOA|nr:conserved Plasmodium protein, unknown function [Plasmodium ovale]
MNDDGISNLIQKIEHHIDDIRDRSIIMLIQKYEKRLINETDFKKRNYFFYIILRYINDRNSFIPLKHLFGILTFVHRIIKNDEEIKKKFEDLDIHKFVKEFLIHFKKNEEKYKSNNSTKKLNIGKEDDICIRTYEKSLAERNDNEYNEIVQILCQLIRTYSYDEEEVNILCSKNETTVKVSLNNETHLLGEEEKYDPVGECNQIDEYDPIGEWNKKLREKDSNLGEGPFDDSNLNLRSGLNAESGKREKTGHSRKSEESRQSATKECTTTTKGAPLHGTHKLKEDGKYNRENEKEESCQTIATVSSSPRSNDTMSEKDRLHINQIMKKNNYINIFTKNNYLTSDDFQHYNTLYCIKNRVNEKSIYLLLNYKRHKANKMKEECAPFNGVTVSIHSLPKERDNEQEKYSHLTNYIFFYLNNFFDSFDQFRKNFLNINGINVEEEILERVEARGASENAAKVGEENVTKGGDKNISKGGGAGITGPRESIQESYFTHLNEKHVYNKNIGNKIANYVNKTKLLHFYLKIKFNYFELLGMNIIKKKISVDDLVYMHKEVNKILNEYIYIFNKDILLFNYKFVYTLSYNIHYIYKNYVENNQSENDFNHINNILNNLSHLIYIIIYSFYINISTKRECLCNSIYNIYVNNFFFLLSQNLFHILLHCKNRRRYHSVNTGMIVSELSEHQKKIEEQMHDRKKSNMQLINNINIFYYKKNVKKFLNNAGYNAILEISPNDMYHYLFITKNNCIYFFKMIIFYMLEILRISYLRINSIHRRCSPLNFHIDHFTLIYDYLYDMIIHYFNDSYKKMDDHVKLLTDFIEEINFFGGANEKAKGDNIAKIRISKKAAINGTLCAQLSSSPSSSSSSSSSSSASSGVQKNKFQSVDILSRDTQLYTYKYGSKQIEILKIVCLYINYTPVSFIQMRKINVKLVNLLKGFLFDIYLNTHYVEILYFFKIFFFFYDYHVYKEYIDFLFYYHSLVNLFFIYKTREYEEETFRRKVHNDKENNSGSNAIDYQSDISTLINASNNIFHFFFFLPTRYTTLNNFLTNYYSEWVTRDSCSYHDEEKMGSCTNARDTFSDEFEPFDSFELERSLKREDPLEQEEQNDSLDTHFREKTQRNSERIGMHNLCNLYRILHRIATKEREKDKNFQNKENSAVEWCQKEKPKFCFAFINNITNVLVENNFKMLFNSLLLLSCEYNNFSTYVKPDEQYSTMYQFIVGKLKQCNDRMLIFRSQWNSKNNEKEIKNGKCIELFRNFFLLLHNIISIIYSYNNEISFFFFNFFFNINHEHSALLREDNEMCSTYPENFNSIHNCNYDVDIPEGRTYHSVGCDKHVENIIPTSCMDKVIKLEEVANRSSKTICRKGTHCDYTNLSNGTPNINGSDGNPPERHPDYEEDTKYVSTLISENIDSEKDQTKFKITALINKNTLESPNFWQTSEGIEENFEKGEGAKWASSEVTISRTPDSTKVELSTVRNENQSNTKKNENYDSGMRSGMHNHNHAGVTRAADLFLSPLQISEFVDVIYELCVYGKKEMKDYYTLFIIENMKKKISSLLDMMKGKKDEDKKTLLKNVKICSKVLLLLYFLKKKYIMIFEQSAYNSFDFLYENYFTPFFYLSKKGKIECKHISNTAYFYENVFLNVHNLYFFLFQRKKKRRTFSLKIMWKLYHQFKMRFSKMGCAKLNFGEMQSGESNISNKEHKTKEGVYITDEEGDTIRRGQQMRSTNQTEEAYKHNEKRSGQHDPDHRNDHYNTFKYSSDWNFKVNILNIYISDFLLKQFIFDETAVINLLCSVDIDMGEVPLQHFKNAISLILKRNAQVGISSPEDRKEGKGEEEEADEDGEAPKEDLLLHIYEKMRNLYAKLIREMLVKERTNAQNVNTFVYVLKIIILLLVTNRRNSRICKKIYSDKYFFLSHVYCFFFYVNEMVKALSLSLSFYLIFDQNITLLHKYRLFLEPHLRVEIQTGKKKIQKYTPHLENYKKNTHLSNTSNNLENSIIHEIEIHNLEKYYAQSEEVIPSECTNQCHIKESEFHLKKFDVHFFNLNRNQNKHAQNDNNIQFDNLKRISFLIEKKIIYFIPFWLYQKLQTNNFLLNVKKYKSFFFFSTKYSYLHIFHDPKLNRKEKELCYHGNYSNNNIILSFFLFVNKYYYISKYALTDLKDSFIKENFQQGSIPILKKNNISDENLDNHTCTFTNLNSFLFLNTKVGIKNVSKKKTSRLTSLMIVLKVLPPINDCTDEQIIFDYIYNLNRFFFFLNNCYMHLLYEHNNYGHNSQMGVNEKQNVNLSVGHKSCKNRGKEVNFVQGNHKSNKIDYLFENDYDEVINAVNFVYDYVFPYMNKLLFFLYNNLTVHGEEKQKGTEDKNVLIHKNLLLLEHLLNVFDICLFINLIAEKKKHMKGKINFLNKEIDLSLFVYKLLYLSVVTSTMKNKISIFSLNIIYNFLKVDNYYLEVKYNCYNNYDEDMNLPEKEEEEEERKNSIILKEEEKKKKKLTEKNKNLSILVNFLFFIISRYTKRIVKKRKKNKENQTNEKSSLYTNIINVYEVEKCMNAENVTFQNHEREYLKNDIFFLRNVMCMLHVIFKKGCFIDIHLKNKHISFINWSILAHYDYKLFTEKNVLEGQNASAIREHTQGIVCQDSINNCNGGTCTLRSDSSGSCSSLCNDGKSEESGTRPADSFARRNGKSVLTFKSLFLNSYTKILTTFCNVYNDIIIECLHVQLLLFFFKYVLQIGKGKIDREYVKDAYKSRKNILVSFLKYYKVDRQICTFLKRVYFIILKYAIYMQNTQISKSIITHDMNVKKGQTERRECTDSGTKVDISKHNYFLEEEDIYKNYCRLFYEYTIDKYRNCEGSEDGEEGEEIALLRVHNHGSESSDYPSRGNKVHSDYVSMIDLYCPNCEEVKILYLSIVLFLSFSLDNFPFFFSQKGNYEDTCKMKKEICEMGEKDNIVLLCERIFHYLSKKNIYRNFSIFKEAKLLEKYFIKIFIKLLYCNEKETMHNLQKFEIYIYTKETDLVHVGSRHLESDYKMNDNCDNVHKESVERGENIFFGKPTTKGYAPCDNGNNRYEKKSTFFTKHMTRDNNFYVNHFLNYFLIEKKRKNNLERIYDKIYYYILIVSMCSKDKNFLSLLLSKDEMFYDEFNKIIQEYLKYVIKNKQEVNGKKKKNETMIRNLLYIFISYIYIYLNELYNIFFTQIKNLLTLPSFFQNVIYISKRNIGGSICKKEHIRLDPLLIDVYYNIIMNMKKKNTNNNLENYTDKNIKNVVVRNIFHNNNIYLFILYIINDNKYAKKTSKEENNSILGKSKNYEDMENSNFSRRYNFSYLKKNNKEFLNKVTTNIILFFLLFFYDYYSFNYEIKENILTQIARHILEHFTTFFNSDFLHFYAKYYQVRKIMNTHKKKKNNYANHSTHKVLNRHLNKNSDTYSLHDSLAENNKKEIIHSVLAKKGTTHFSKKNPAYSRAHDALSKIREEGKKKRETAKTMAELGQNKGIGAKGVTNKGIGAKGVTNKGSSPKGVTNKGSGAKGVTNKGSGAKGVTNKGSDTKGGGAKGEDAYVGGAIAEVQLPESRGELSETDEEVKEAGDASTYAIIGMVEKMKRNKTLLFLYTTNCFRIIQTYCNISSLLFTYRYISVLLQKFAHFANQNVVESIFDSFDFYVHSCLKKVTTYEEDKCNSQRSSHRHSPSGHLDKEAGYLSYVYINYFFNFISCFLLYDTSTLQKFCSNSQNCLDTINGYFKELIANKKGIYICIAILNFYLTITNTSFFDFSLYESTLNEAETETPERMKEEGGEIKQNETCISEYVLNNLRRKKRTHDGGETNFDCIKKLSSHFSRSKFTQFLINYVLDNIENDINKNKIQIERKNHVIVLILQLLSYQTVCIDNKNETLKLASTLMKYLKKKDVCIVVCYYIILFFNSCFLNTIFDERLINLLFNFDKNDNLWFNFIFLSSNKMKKGKDVLTLIKFSILHLYLLLLKNKNSFKKSILCISSDINIYFVFIYILNEIYEYFKSFNNEQSIHQKVKMGIWDNKQKEVYGQNKGIKYFYLYTELLVIITEIIKILNMNDVNKYITLQHNKEKNNLTIQFKNLYKKIKYELKSLEELIKLTKYTILIHPLMTNIHILHKYYLCIYIKEFYYFHKTFFKYDIFLVNYLQLIKNKRKKKYSPSCTYQQGEEDNNTTTTTINFSSENVTDGNNTHGEKNDIKKNDYTSKNNVKNGTLQNGENLHNKKISFYFFFNTPKNYNYQVNTLCSSILQNEFHGSLSKFFSSSFLDSYENIENCFQYNMEQIKIYVDYIYDSVNYAIDFFNSL